MGETPTKVKRFSIERRLNRRGCHWHTWDNWLDSEAEAMKLLKQRMKKHKGYQWRIVRGKTER